MQDTAWPFVTTRNQEVGHRTLVAPGFLLDIGLTSVLDMQGTVVGDHPWPPTYHRVTHPRLGELTLVFRSVAATQRLVGGLNGDRLKDRFGRPIFIIEGYAIQSGDPDVEAAERALPRVHQMAERAFRDFWGSTDEEYPVKPSQGLSLGPEVPVEQLSAERSPDPPRRVLDLLRDLARPARWPRVLTGGLLAAACTGAALLVVLRRGRC